VANANLLHESESQLYEPYETGPKRFRFIYEYTDPAGRVQITRINNLPSEVSFGFNQAWLLWEQLQDERALRLAGYTQSPKEGLRNYSIQAKGTPYLTPEGEAVFGKAIMAGQQAVEMPELFEDELTRESAVDLAGLAWDRLVTSNLGTAVKIAKKFESWVPLAEAIQYANDGIMRAAASFDYREEKSFYGWAYFWVRNSIQQGMRVVRSDIMISNERHKAIRQYLKFRDDYIAIINPGVVPSSDEICEALGWDPDHLTKVQIDAASESRISHLDAPILKGSTLLAKELPLSDVVADPKSDRGFDSVDLGDRVERVIEVIKKLPEPQRSILLKDVVLSNLEDTDPDRSSEKRARDRKAGIGMLLHPSSGLLDLMDTGNSRYAKELEHAACEGVDTRVFFPGEERLLIGNLRESLCNGCPQKSACQAFAEEQGIKDGYFGNVNIRRKANDKYEAKQKLLKLERIAS